VLTDLTAGGRVLAVAPLTVANVERWFTDSAQWHGPAAIPHRVFEHLVMSGAAVATAVVIALPIGLVFGHTRRGGTTAVNVANAGRAIPSFALLVVGFELLKGVKLFGLGALPAYFALVALAIPPIILNAVVGLRQVDAEIKEAARGMGMTGGQVLRRVELPMAVPLIMAGVRTAGVQVVATATLAAVVGWGGLGTYIVGGLDQQDKVQLVAGALMVALLALVTEIGLGAAQRGLTPRGLRTAHRTRKVSALPGVAAAPTADEQQAAAA
jgi:osmoprotectant transport system permease protein